MNTAHIKQYSAIWNLWRAHHRVGGIIYGAHFAWEPGNIYRTGPLSPEQAALLRAHDCVEVDGVAEALPSQRTELSRQPTEVLLAAPAGSPLVGLPASPAGSLLAGSPPAAAAKPQAARRKPSAPPGGAAATALAAAAAGSLPIALLAAEAPPAAEPLAWLDIPLPGSHAVACGPLAGSQSGAEALQTAAEPLRQGMDALEALEAPTAAPAAASAGSLLAGSPGSLGVLATAPLPKVTVPSRIRPHRR